MPPDVRKGLWPSVSLLFDWAMPNLRAEPRILC
jgi:hypothetical protein